MEFFRSPIKALTARLDVNFYRPGFIENQSKLERMGCKRFGDLYSDSGIGHTASVEPHYSPDGTGIPFISGKAVKPNELHIERAERILVESHISVMAKTRLRPCDLLAVRKGDVGSACVVPATAKELNCSSEIMFFRFEEQMMSYYLCAYLNSTHGALATKRSERGSLIPGVSLYDVPDLSVFWPHKRVRSYLGDKVRQAERLREKAREAIEEARALVEALIAGRVSEFDIVADTATKVQLPRARKRSASVDEQRDKFHINRISRSDIEPILAAQSYRPEITEASRQVKSFRRWERLQSICSNTISPGPHPEYSESGHPCLKTKNVSDLIVSCEHVDWVPQKLAYSLERFSVQDEDVLMNLTGAGSIGRVAIYFGTDKPLTNQHLARLSILEPNDPAYVCCFLSSWWGERIIAQGISGSTGQLNLVNEQVRSMPIPLPLPAVQSHIGNRIRWAGRYKAASTQLVAASKLLVEALIEGHLTESELKVAQEALEHGDRGPDRAILARLTRKGIDVPGEPPLFPDLDALYRAIDQVNETGIFPDQGANL